MFLHTLLLAIKLLILSTNILLLYTQSPSNDIQFLSISQQRVVFIYDLEGGVLEYLRAMEVHGSNILESVRVYNFDCTCLSCMRPKVQLTLQVDPGNIFLSLLSLLEVHLPCLSSIYTSTNLKHYSIRTAD